MGCLQSAENSDHRDTAKPLLVAKENKVIMIGNSSVGKSSLVASLLHRPFSFQQESTIGAAYSRVTISPPGKSPVDVTIWDTAGEEKFRSMTSFYYRKANVAILVFDVNNPDSLLGLENWRREIVRVSPHIQFVLVGNKCEAQCRQSECAETIATLVELKDIPLFFTSAQTGEGVLTMFQHAAAAAALL